MPMSSSSSSRSIGSEPPWVWQSMALASTSSTSCSVNLAPARKRTYCMLAHWACWRTSQVKTSSVTPSASTLVSCLRRSTRSSLTLTLRISDSGRLSSGLTLSRRSSGMNALLGSDEATRAWLGEDFVVLHNDTAAQDGGDGYATHRPALEGRPAALRVAARGGDRVLAVEINHHQIGIRAGRNGALARVQAHQAGRIGAAQLDDAPQADPTGV